MTAPRMRRRAPEIVQSSMMDCGPAALKCLLEGFGISVSYGRLREVCQTDVDGTSIDMIETVAKSLGLAADQVMIPADHLFSQAHTVLPALVVVRHPEGSTHFVVAWARAGEWLQVMDPSVGRRWVRCRDFKDEIFRHRLEVGEADWREWAATDDFVVPLRERMAQAEIGQRAELRLIEEALGREGWIGIGALDAGLRLVQAMIDAGAIDRGREARRLLGGLIRQTCEGSDIFRIVPAEYWSALPAGARADGEPQLLLRGAVLLRVSGRSSPTAADIASESEPASDSGLSPALKAVLSEKMPSPWASLFEHLKAGGLLAPALVVTATTVAVGANLAEAFLFRGIFDIGPLLNLGSQRLLAAAALIAFLMAVLFLRVPIATETLRFGRQLDARLRSALLQKLPRLADRYFQSRSIADMADRGHLIHQTRGIPALGMLLVETLIEMTFTLVGLALLDPASSAFGLVAVAGILVIPLLFQSAVNERDLRVRSHSAALNGFYLDSLLGLTAIRAHRAQRAVRHQHESLLVEWVRSSRRLVRASLAADGIQAAFAALMVAALLVEHFLRTDRVTGADLLLVYWALKLIELGYSVVSLAKQYPAQRNVMLRLLEPLSAPEQNDAPDGGAVIPFDRGAMRRRTRTRSRGIGIAIENGAVVAAGHPILRDINLVVAPGEHVAVVGLSGAGKSTLLGLLLGWHALAEGRLLVDGEELAADGLEPLRRSTAWVDPAVQVWNRPLLDNLAYSAPDANLGRISGAIEAARLREVVQALPDGLQTVLGESGGLLSGGEGQRVRLGRALMQSDVRLVLLDEPFRGMDREQRKVLLSEARCRWQHATMLCVTHDVGETASFDRVLVVEDGKIVEDGSPARLAWMESRYRDLLETERSVRDRLWAGDYWRRIWVENGHVRRAG